MSVEAIALLFGHSIDGHDDDVMNASRIVLSLTNNFRVHQAVEVPWMLLPICRPSAPWG